MEKLTISNESYRESSVVYEVPINIDKDHDLREKADFVYKNAREYLLATMDTRKTLERKALLMLSFIVAAVSFGIAKSLNIYSEIIPGSNNLVHSYTLVFWILLILGYFVIAIMIVFKIFSPKSEYTPGNETKHMVCQENMDQYFPLMQIGVAWIYQERINFNLTKNAIYANTIKWCLLAMLSLPPILILIIFSLYFWFPQWHLVHY